MKIIIILIGFLKICLACNAGVNDMVINEILFNPSKDGYDYIELFNRTRDSVNLKNILIANRNITHDIAAVKAITKNDLFVPSHHFVLITSNAKWLKQNYNVSSDAIICELSSLPSFPDDKGTVLI